MSDISEQLKNLDDEEFAHLREELKQEQLRRTQVAYAKARRRNRERIQALKDVWDVLSPFVPHTCSDCSDEDPKNGYSERDGYAACNRCHALEVMYDDDERFFVDVQLQIRKTAEQLPHRVSSIAMESDIGVASCQKHNKPNAKRK